MSLRIQTFDDWVLLSKVQEKGFLKRRKSQGGFYMKLHIDLVLYETEQIL